jgi:pimeloyl-ACP methyl ester carboxylesterase
VVDLVAAAQRIPGVPKSAPFLTGFSEGGYASLAAHHALEAAGQQVRGTAVIAGAYNLGTISIPWMLEGRTAQAATSLALLVRGYAQRYGHPLHSAFTPRYATLVPEMLDMGRPAEEIRAALPADPRALFRSDALAALDSKGGHWLADALAANDIGDWALKAPVRFYYGEADIHEPPADPKEAARRLAARGSDTAAISVGAADHGRVTALAAPQILAWLDMLASAKILPLRRRG